MEIVVVVVVVNARPIPPIIQIHPAVVPNAPTPIIPITISLASPLTSLCTSSRLCSKIGLDLAMGKARLGAAQVLTDQIAESAPLIPIEDGGRRAGRGTGGCVHRELKKKQKNEKARPCSKTSTKSEWTKQTLLNYFCCRVSTTVPLSMISSWCLQFQDPVYGMGCRIAYDLPGRL